MTLNIKLLLIMIMINILLQNLAARLAQADLIGKSDIANFIKKANLNKNKLNELSKNLK